MCVIMQVLTTGYWPTPQSTEGLALPEELRALQDRFNDFYTAKYQGRRLVWAHSLERSVGYMTYIYVLLTYLLTPVHKLTHSHCE